MSKTKCWIVAAVCFLLAQPVLAFWSALFYGSASIDFDTLDVKRFAGGDLPYMIKILKVHHHFGQVPRAPYFVHVWLMPLMLLAGALGWTLARARGRRPLMWAAFATVPAGIYVMVISYCGLWRNRVLGETGQLVDELVLGALYPLIICGVCAIVNALQISIRFGENAPPVPTAPMS